jgi:hypothetical protein
MWTGARRLERAEGVARPEGRVKRSACNDYRPFNAKKRARMRAEHPLTRRRFLQVAIWAQLLGAVGIGSLITKLLDIFWLQRLLQDNEQARWLRDHKYAAYSALSKEVKSGGLWKGTTTDAVADGLVADAMLLTDDKQLRRRVQTYLSEVRAAKDIASQIRGGAAEKQQDLNDRLSRLDAEAPRIIELLGQDLLR